MWLGYVPCLCASCGTWMGVLSSPPIYAALRHRVRGFVEYPHAGNCIARRPDRHPSEKKGWHKATLSVSENQSLPTPYYVPRNGNTLRPGRGHTHASRCIVTLCEDIVKCDEKCVIKTIYYLWWKQNCCFGGFDKVSVIPPPVSAVPEPSGTAVPPLRPYA